MNETLNDTTSSTVIDACEGSAPVTVVIPSREILMSNSWVDEQPEKMFDLELDPAERRVAVYEKHPYDGISADLWHQLSLTLGSTRGVTSPQALKKDIEALQTDLQVICDGFEEHWDGSNNVGTYSEEAYEALELVRRRLQDILVGYEPRLLDVYEQCDPQLDELTAEQIKALDAEGPESEQFKELLGELCVTFDEDQIAPSEADIESYLTRWLGDRIYVIETQEECREA